GGARARRGRDGEEPGPGRQARLELVEPQGAVLGADADELDGRPGVAGGPHPGGDVGVVVEPGDDHLVAGSPGGRQSPAEGERQRRHVLAEGDLGGAGGAEQGGGGAAGGGPAGDGRPRGGGRG